MATDACIDELVSPSDLQAARRPKQQILRALAHHGYPEQAVFAVKLALEEAVVNAIKHGNRGDPNKYITIGYDVNARRAVVTVGDEGAGFCPGSVPDCTRQENLVRPCGRGIMLMRAYMDKVQYSRKGTMVRMTKYNRAEP